MSENPELSPRIAIQVALALAGEGGASEISASLHDAARRIGLSAAEMDAAWSGRSFEAKACAAIRLARAIRAGGDDELAAAREHAAEFGLCPIEIEQVEQLASPSGKVGPFPPG